MHIVSIVGTRPNIVKMAPIDRALSDYGVTTTLVHTGQHYDHALSGLFFEQLGLRKPDYNLGIGSGSHAEQTARILLRIEPLLVDLEPDAVLVTGDVNSAMAASLAACKLHVPVVHVEAGLRSGDRSMPEEINRILIDHMADWLFTTERAANENLACEGIPEERVHFVGNVMIDTLKDNLQRSLDSYKPPYDDYVLLTLHRPSNVDNKPVLQDILASVQLICAHVPVVFPAHPRTVAKVEEFCLWDTLECVDVTGPVGYLEFLSLMHGASAVLTDSGGIEEETTVLGVPCLTMRYNTERPVTITEGTNRLVGNRFPCVAEAVLDVLQSEDEDHPSVPERWDGQASERIAQCITAGGLKRDRGTILTRKG